MSSPPVRAQALLTVASSMQGKADDTISAIQGTGGFQYRGSAPGIGISNNARRLH
ncbi:hypothetical protein [Nostoc sp.]